MIDVAVLRPSQIEDLSSRPWSDTDKRDVLSGIAEMLDKTPSDGGADSDRIYMAASHLTIAGAWQAISTIELARVVGAARLDAQNDFLDGLPRDVAGLVSREILRQLEQTLSRPLSLGA
ncbi:hypothetical protein M2360_004594 [Rhizobium sp. SG_E_25_P2]|uniref:hypothetical protein n=1 Tax=Rhizobium sp. SG_E_25_P2 TaxID=2879942 RepID=UPI002473EA77|nr:hypothetical protein [Rhizobium sp. SG_E_25_P2]MDH6269168.1 hypothetical protein [Rhizobium sp. SG_E_25_P2]